VYIIGAVSPAALLIPRIDPVKIPGNAAGSTIFLAFATEHRRIHYGKSMTSSIIPGRRNIITMTALPRGYSFSALRQWYVEILLLDLLFFLQHLS